MEQPDWLSTYFDPALNSAAVRVGYGGQGEVWANPRDQPQWVVKRAKQATSRAEFDTNCALRAGTLEAYQAPALVQVVHSPLLRDRAMVMERIVHPAVASSLLGAVPGYDPHVALQAYLGVAEAPETTGVVRTIAGRGMYLTLDAVAALVVGERSQPALERTKRLLVADLATFIATVQYGLRYDGSDMEYLVGHTIADRQERLYCVDFDRVRAHGRNEYETASRDLVDALARALDSEPYYPMAGDHPLATLFATRYVATATHYDAAYRTLAERVLEDAAM